MIWITFKNGEVRKYNGCYSYLEKEEWVDLHTDSSEKFVIAQLRLSEISMIEFHQPCEVTFSPNVFESAINVILKRAKAIRDESNLNKLADLVRFLRKFNPQRKVWK